MRARVRATCMSRARAKRVAFCWPLLQSPVGEALVAQEHERERDREMRERGRARRERMLLVAKSCESV